MVLDFILNMPSQQVRATSVMIFWKYNGVKIKLSFLLF